MFSHMYMVVTINNYSNYSNFSNDNNISTKIYNNNVK